jgi:hypothetical protein
MLISSKAAEANMSLGNVSYSHQNEQFFQRAVRFLRRASQIPGFRLSPYLQRYKILPREERDFADHGSYLDDYGRLVS